MSKKNLGESSKELYELLSGLDKDDRRKVLQSVLALFGEENVSAPGAEPGKDKVKKVGDQTSGFTAMGAKEFLSQKNPENRGEVLAVAARYLELVNQLEVIRKENFKEVFKEARRNFDSGNFVRDMTNAIHNAKLFISGGEKETYKLSFYGQEYVDALPDRDVVRLIKRPGGAKKKGTAKTKIKTKEQ